MSIMRTTALQRRARRFAGAGTLLAVSVALTAGCAVAGSSPRQAASSPREAASSPPSAREILAAAAPGDSSGRYRISVKDSELTVRGVVDPAGRRYRLGFRQPLPGTGVMLAMDFLVIEKRSWVKVAFEGADKRSGLPRLPRTWLRLDPSKIKDRGQGSMPLAYDGAADPANSAVLFAAVVDARQQGVGRYTGTLDVTRAKEAEVLTAQQLTALGDRARSLPFEATLDRQGDLASLTVEVPAVGKRKAWRWAATYSDYGTAPALPTPSGRESQPAPPTVYEMLNS